MIPAWARAPKTGAQIDAEYEAALEFIEKDPAALQLRRLIRKLCDETHHPVHRAACINRSIRYHFFADRPYV